MNIKMEELIKLLEQLSDDDKKKLVDIRTDIKDLEDDKSREWDRFSNMMKNVKRTGHTRASTRSKAKIDDLILQIDTLKRERKRILDTA